MDSAGWQAVALAVIAGMVTLGAPVIAFFLARVSAQQSRVLAATDAIHTVVNSNQERMERNLAEMNTRVADLSATNGELQEAARTLALVAARAEAPPIAHAGAVLVVETDP